MLGHAAHSSFPPSSSPYCIAAATITADFPLPTTMATRSSARLAAPVVSLQRSKSSSGSRKRGHSNADETVNKRLKGDEEDSSDGEEEKKVEEKVKGRGKKGCISIFS